MIKSTILFLNHFSIHDQEEEVTGVISRYETELRGLRDVVRQKQNFIEKIQTDKE